MYQFMIMFMMLYFFLREALFCILSPTNDKLLVVKARLPPVDFIRIRFHEHSQEGCMVILTTLTTVRCSFNISLYDIQHIACMIYNKLLGLISLKLQSTFTFYWQIEVSEI